MTYFNVDLGHALYFGGLDQLFGVPSHVTLWVEALPYAENAGVILAGINDLIILRMTEGTAHYLSSRLYQHIISSRSNSRAPI